MSAEKSRKSRYYMRDSLNAKRFVRNIDTDRVYFYYKRAPYLRYKWPLVVLAIVEVGVLAAELLLNHTAYMQVLTIPLILHGLYRILKRKEDLDKDVEARIVEEQLDGQIPGRGKAKVIAKEYFIVTPHEAYLRDKRFMLVVLSDGKVYRYGVEPAQKNGFVLDKNASLCIDDGELKLVKKYTDQLKTEDKTLKVKRKAGIAAAGILAVGAIFIGLVFWLVGTTSWMKIVGWVLYAVIILSMVLSFSLSSYSDKKGFIGTAYRVSSTVLGGLWLLVQLVFPSLLLMVGFMFIVLVPFALINLALKALNSVVAITPQTILFISLSVGAIISAYYSKPLFGWFSRVLTANGHRYEKYFQEMVEYVYQPSNIQFVIYLLYFIYLAISTVHLLQAEGAPLFGNGWDLAVLESFLVFIAFSNMKKKRVGASFSFFELFRMMWGMWTTHDNVKEDEDMTLPDSTDHQN